MKTFTFSVATAILASSASAFPAMLANNEQWSPWTAPSPHEKRQLLNPPQGAGALPLTPPPFDAASQHVSNTGDHAYQDPGPNDERGECPGLNALANQSVTCQSPHVFPPLILS